eukprot:TRINITY_DN38930_c0_g1_i1.p1 TRINITY_DN38930_c0_g1~~TRINITY_DN38930_c0_g1_i1.p1  ORF type:complete len:115 (-),score=5.54 TRINITY_DN38930_c0_g1_i1:126-470(-)
MNGVRGYGVCGYLSLPPLLLHVWYWHYSAFCISIRFHMVQKQQQQLARCTNKNGGVGVVSSFLGSVHLTTITYCTHTHNFFTISAFSYALLCMRTNTSKQAQRNKMNKMRCGAK